MESSPCGKTACVAGVSIPEVRRVHKALLREYPNVHVATRLPNHMLAGDWAMLWIRSQVRRRYERRGPVDADRIARYDSTCNDM